MTAGTPPHHSTVMMRFLIVWMPLAYNAILGQSGLNLLDVVIFTKWLLVQFSIDNGIGEMWEESNPVLPCYHTVPGS